MNPSTGALNRLNDTLDRVSYLFPVTTWEQIEPAGGKSYELVRNFFKDLIVSPNQDIVLRCKLDLPEQVEGITLAGDEMIATLFSIYPTDVAHNGRRVFEDQSVPVAAGPAQFTIVPKLLSGDNGELTMRIRVPNNQATPWVQMHVSTPRIRKRLMMLDIAWSQLFLGDALATSESEREIVERAAQLVPERLLPADEEVLAQALQRMAETLSPLAEKIRKLRVHLIGHSHIDMNWLWTWPDTVETIRRDFRSVLGLMDEFPEMTFSHSQPATYEVVREQEPAMFEKVRQHIASGRWEATNLQWVEGDVNMASGEAQARQMLEAVWYTRKVLGAEPSTFHAPDTFGHAGNLPQLAVSAGAKRYYHHRVNPGQADLWPAYWWEGQDGTRLLAISTSTYNNEIRASKIAQAAVHAFRHGHRVALHFHGVGDHGGGPARQGLELLQRLKTTPLLPQMLCSTMERYTNELLEAGTALPVHRGEMNSIFEGCYTTHADTKLYNRRGENLLSTADTLCALAGINRNDELSAAWRKVLFNQFHDIFDGSAIHEAYEDNRRDFEAAHESAEKMIAEALDVLERNVARDRIAVTNPLGFERDEWVVVPDISGDGPVTLRGDHGHTAIGQYTADGLGFVARVPAFATASYAIATDSPPATVIEAQWAFAPTDDRANTMLADRAEQAPYLLVETPHFRAYVRRDCGIITLLLDKRVGRELVGFGMRRGSDYIDTARPDLAINVLQLLEEHPHGMTAWQIHEVHTEYSLLRGAETRVIETGPARCVLEVTHKLRKSTISQRIIFYRDLPRIDFDTRIDWQELGNKEAGVPNLKLAFTARMQDCQAWFETPFAAVRRPADGQESPALRWADVGGDDYGFAILNDTKHGYDALGNRLRLTLVRSAYDPDAISDIGQHRVRCSFMPHPGNWRDAGVVEAGMSFNQPLLARGPGQQLARGVEPRPAGVRPAISGAPTIKIACLKQARNGRGMIIRLYESAGRTGEVRLHNLPHAALYETNIIEDPIKQLESSAQSVSLLFRRWQVRTILATWDD